MHKELVHIPGRDTGKDMTLETRMPQHTQHGSSTPTPESAMDSKSTTLPSAASRKESLFSFAVGVTSNLFQQFVGFIKGIKMSLSFPTLFGGLNTTLC